MVSAALYFHHKTDPVFEDAPPPTTTFIVCSMPRSGSSLLCDLLASTELAGAPTEYFDRNQMDALRGRWGTTTFEDYIARLLKSATSPNGVFGLKAHFHQFADAFRGIDPASVLPNLHLIYVTRRDRVGQAVSFAIATQTEQWTARQAPAGGEPAYDGGQIRYMLDWIEREERAWESFFAGREEPLLRIVYEEFAGSVEKTVLDAMDFLEIALPTGFAVPAPTLSRQAGPLNLAWAERFERERSGP
jgi:LPS sulfotransferase NodH